MKELTNTSLLERAIVKLAHGAQNNRAF
nr:unnamed protein product [Callosobruchus chinensis]